MRVSNLIGFICAASLTITAAAAGPVSSRTSRGGVALNETDARLLQNAVDKALNENRAGATAEWSDIRTNHGGRATVLRLYSQNQKPCGEVEHVFTLGGGNSYKLPFCKQADGAWKIEFPN